LNGSTQPDNIHHSGIPSKEGIQGPINIIVSLNQKNYVIIMNIRQIINYLIIAIIRVIIMQENLH